MMPEFCARIILLGASNITKAISSIIGTATDLLGSPIEVDAAIGHGRSYGMRSTVLVRSLPSILDSSLWEVVNARSAASTYALVGDIGNDVMYGASPAMISAWVEACFDRLDAIGAKIVCTSLPLARIELLNEWQYLIARSLLFPMRRLPFDEAMSRARDVVERVEAKARARDIAFLELPREWYGIDPIHIRRSHRAAAWNQVLRYWLNEAATANETLDVRTSLSRWLTLRSKSPETWWLFGKKRGRAQPCATLPDGTVVSLY